MVGGFTGRGGTVMTGRTAAADTVVVKAYIRPARGIVTGVALV